MEKDFDEWNEVKKRIDLRREIFCNRREIWWSSVGINVGSEENGKNNLFERPVLVLKVFNKKMIRVLPLTSKIKDDDNHIPISYEGRTGSAIFSQMRTISTKRLSRKLCRLDKIQFERVKERLSVNFR